MSFAAEFIIQSPALVWVPETKWPDATEPAGGLHRRGDYVFDSLPIWTKWPMRGQLRQDMRPRRCVGTVSACAISRALTTSSERGGRVRLAASALSGTRVAGGVGGWGWLSRQHILHVSLPQFIQSFQRRCVAQCNWTRVINTYSLLLVWTRLLGGSLVPAWGEKNKQHWPLLTQTKNLFSFTGRTLFNFFFFFFVLM